METMPTGEERTAGYGIDLYWLPLGAGGWFVRMNGRIYEAVMARREHRPPCDLYHSALEVRVPEGRFVIENAWPIPDRDGDARGVVVEGPVGSPGLGRLRTFRYEIRRWRDGRIPDIAYAVASPQCVSSDPDRARLLLSLVSSVPALRWGRDELGIGDMWNSNSTVSWLLTSSGLLVDEIRPPRGGRVPGWRAGIELAAATMSEWADLGIKHVWMHRSFGTGSISDRATEYGRAQPAEHIINGGGALRLDRYSGGLEWEEEVTSDASLGHRADRSRRGDLLRPMRLRDQHGCASVESAD